MTTCPHCGGDISIAMTRSQRHYEMLAKYANGRRSLKEVARLMNADPDFKSLYLQKRTEGSVKYGVRAARAAGWNAQSRPYFRRVHDKAAVLAAWRSGDSHKKIAKRLGTSSGCVSSMIRSEIARERAAIGDTTDFDFRHPDQLARERRQVVREDVA